MISLKQLQQEEREKFEEGNYAFRFEYRSKKGEWRWEIASVNDNVTKVEALKIVAKHVSEFDGGKITDFVENNYFKSLLTDSNLRTAKLVLDAYFKSLLTDSNLRTAKLVLDAVREEIEKVSESHMQLVSTLHDQCLDDDLANRVCGVCGVRPKDIL